jgi:hypothetical protein
MIIRVGADGALELRQADDFKGFHIEAESANSDRTSLIAAIAPIGRSDGADFWIDIEMLKQLSGRQRDPHWARRFHIPDKVRAAYLRTKFLDERRDLMQQWAEYVGSSPPEATAIARA